MTFLRTIVRMTPDIPFQLTSVDETPAPAGCEGVWQRYVITQGANTIVGVRSGVHEEVNAIATDLVGRLNQRFAKAAPAPKFSRARGRPAKKVVAAEPASEPTT
jgi:hypothetical protein